MKEYVAVPKDMLENVSLLRSWVGEAFEYASSLKAKTKKAAGAKSKKCRKC